MEVLGNSGSFGLVEWKKVFEDFKLKHPARISKYGFAGRVVEHFVCLYAKPRNKIPKTFRTLPIHKVYSHFKQSRATVDILTMWYL